MRIDPLRQYAKLRQQLLGEKTRLEARLNEINRVLEVSAVVSPEKPLARTPAAGGARRGRRAANKMSLREAMTQALAKGPLSRKELGQAVKDLGYVSNAKDPLGSMGVILYAKNTPFKRSGGKFYLPANAPAPSSAAAAAPEPKKRTRSPETIAKMAAAQRRRWARVRREK